MITVEQAEDIVMSTAYQLPDELVPLDKATGRVLHEALTADRDMPPYDRVAMDGIALCFEDFEKGTRTFSIGGLQPAGLPPLRLLQSGTCLEVMTGAVLPEGANAVIRYEDVTINDGEATVQVDKVNLRQNIHSRGADRNAGALLVPPGRLLSPAEVGIAATVGKTHLKVASLARIAIVSTGNELVGVSDTPLPHQIRRSNAHAMQAAAHQWGATTALFHLNDDEAEISKTLLDIFPHFDALLLSGGVSMGKLDFLPKVLKSLDVQELFHKIAQRPGKPFWFGRKPEGAVVFAFPGNPVSTFLCLYRYFRLWLLQSQGLLPAPVAFARLNEEVEFAPALTRFLQVRTEMHSDGSVWATPAKSAGSGDLVSLADTDAFLELPATQQHFDRGESFRLWSYR